MNRRRYLTLVGSAGAAATLAGCTGGGADEGGQETTATTEAETGTATADATTEGDAGAQGEFPVTITQSDMKTTLDPHNHRTTSTRTVLRHAYEGLLARDRKGKVVDELATDYERKEAGRVRFHLREGVTFHSGEKLTPEDVAFSINRIVEEDVGGLASPQADELSGVTGASVVDGGRAVDVTSDGPNPIVFSLFATFCDVMQKSWVESRSKSEIAADTNGTGPFELADYEEDVHVVFERFEDYWDEPAAVSEVTFEMATESSTRVNQLVSGETDVIVNVPPQEVARVKGSDAARIAAVPSTRVIFNAMRTDREPFTSAKFRRAMNHAVDMNSILENVLSGFGDATSQPTLEGFVGHDPNLEPYPYDKAKAEQLVEESGQAGAEITLHTPAGRYLKDMEIAQAVVGYIDDLSNVSASVKQRDFGALGGSLSDGKDETGPDFYLLGWGNPTFDASQTLIPLLTSDGVLSSYSDEEVDELVSKAGEAGDEERRASLLKRANARLRDRAPWIFLNRQSSVYGVSERVEWTPRLDEGIDAYAMSPKSN